MKRTEPEPTSNQVDSSSPERQRAHLVGVSERGMTGLAQVLLNQGFRVHAVRGDPGLDDRQARRLASLGLRLDEGHGPWRGPHKPRWVVFAPETPETHPERLRAARHGVEQRSQGELLGDLLSTHAERVACVSLGGRPRSTAARLGWGLMQAGRAPTVLLSTASAPQLGGWGRFGQGSTAVLEGLWPSCLQQSVGLTALVIQPPIAADRWSEPRAPVESLPSGQPLLVWEPLLEHAPRWLLEHPGLRTVGFRRGCAWRAAHLKRFRGRIRFRLFSRGSFVSELDVDGTGPGSVADATAAAALALHLGTAAGELENLFHGFRGLERQGECLGQYRGVSVLDDRAETWRASQEALTRCRELFPGRRVVVLIQQARIPRGADRVLRLTRPPTSANLEHVVRRLDSLLEPGNVLLTLGTSAVRDVADAFLRRLSGPGQAS